ncbi:MAG: HAMP domain-containing histidine kinase, partial [Nitrososphaera sp.]|nr:HAMP domain-containing histidine kinase [Nitrososphaera sp.]
EEEATFASSLNNAVYLTAVILIISIAVTLAIVILILHSISKPLTGLRHVTHEISRGNFEAVVEANRDDEIGELAADFEKMKQKLKEKDRLKEEFINIAAHELRTPVLPIVLTAEELADEIDSANREKIERIMRNARRLNKLTNDILDVSRIESNTFKINKSKMNIVRLVQDVIVDARTGIKNGQTTQVILQSRLSEERQEIFADKERIQQVLTNLVNNAITIADNGTITIVIENDPGSKESIMVRVTDTGTGIDPSIMKTLFQKFVTGQNRAKGTGLGLFICKAIIEAHDGQIGAENNKNGGATFTFSLPVSDRSHKDHDASRSTETGELLKASHG